jgi:hypothetical protein
MNRQSVLAGSSSRSLPFATEERQADFSNEFVERPDSILLTFRFEFSDDPSDDRSCLGLSHLYWPDRLHGFFGRRFPTTSQPIVRVVSLLTHADTGSYALRSPCPRFYRHPLGGNGFSLSFGVSSCSLLSIQCSSVSRRISFRLSKDKAGMGVHPGTRPDTALLTWAFEQRRTLAVSPVAIILFETIALGLTRYMPTSWLREGKGGSPLAATLFITCL